MELFCVFLNIENCRPSSSAIPESSLFRPTNSLAQRTSFIFTDSSFCFTVKRTPVQAIKDPQPHSKVTFIVAILFSVVLFLLLLVIAAILYRRRQVYGGFYICTTPPLPDLIARLDSSIPLIEQVNKLPYDKRWEFPREQLQFGKNGTTE